jgi:hypothetical protein
LIPRRAEAGVALESCLGAADLQRHWDDAGVTTVGDIAVGGNDPGLVFAARVGRVEEGHELDHDGRWPMILVAIRVMAPARAGVSGPGRVGRDGWILDVAR